MTLIAHATLSLMAGQFEARLRKSSLNKKEFLLLLLAGALPDLPLTVVTLLGQFHPGLHHHEWVTHAPLFWMLVSLIVALKNKTIAKILVIGTLMHLASDWYGAGDGIMFLWPFDRTQYGIWLSGVHGKPAIAHYFSIPILAISEVLLLFYLLITLYKFFYYQRDEGI